MIEDVNKYFAKEYGIHSHDFVLGQLSQKGNTFVYMDEVWNYAPPEFYKANISGVVINKKTGSFFEPEKRIFELSCSLRELEELDFDCSIKESKRKQV